MSQLPGTVRVTGPIATSDTTDKYPTHYANLGAGGLFGVASVAERDLIPAQRRVDGMLIYVAATKEYHQLGTDLSTWKNLGDLDVKGLATAIGTSLDATNLAVTQLQTSLAQANQAIDSIGVRTGNLETGLNATNLNVTTVGTRVTAVETGLGQTNQAVTQVGTRVTAVEQTQAAQGQLITTHTGQIATNTTDISDLETEAIQATADFIGVRADMLSETTYRDDLQQTTDTKITFVSKTGLEIYDIFSKHPNGAPVAAITGQPWLLNGTHGSIGSIVNGKLTAIATEPQVATYSQIKAEGPIRNIGTSVVFSPYTTTGGAAEVGTWATQMDNDTVTPPSDSNCHWVINPVSWAYGIFQNGVLTNLASQFWPTPLTADQLSVYRPQAWIDYASSSINLVLVGPDGKRVWARKFTDPRIAAIPCSYINLESFRNVATDSMASFLDVWADSRLPNSSEFGDLVLDMPRRLKVNTYTAAGISYVAPATGGSVAIDETNIYVDHFATTTKALLTFSGFFKFTAATDLYLTARIITSTFGSQQVVNGAEISIRPTDGFRTVVIPISGLTPGVTYRLIPGHLQTVASASSLSVDSAKSRTCVISAQSID